MFRAILLAVALLTAQQSALAHDIWHADAAPSQSDEEKKLCDLHTALGTVVGALDAAGGQAPVHHPGICAWSEHAAPLPGSPGPVPASRGPPDPLT